MESQAREDFSTQIVGFDTDGEFSAGTGHDNAGRPVFKRWRSIGDELYFCNVAGAHLVGRAVGSGHRHHVGLSENGDDREQKSC